MTQSGWGYSVTMRSGPPVPLECLTTSTNGAPSPAFWHRCGFLFGGELGDCQEANALGLLASLAATSKACAQERWLRAPPGGGRSRCMGGSQEAEKMGHSSEQCQGLSAGTGRGNRARGCGKQRHTATYVCSQWARDKAAKEREAARRPGPSHYLQQRLPCASSRAGHPKRARDARVGLGACGCWAHIGQNHGGSAGGRAGFWVWLVIS